MEPAAFDLLSPQQVNLEGSYKSKAHDFIVNFWRFVLAPMVNSGDQFSKEVVDNL